MGSISVFMQLLSRIVIFTHLMDIMPNLVWIRMDVKLVVVGPVMVVSCVRACETWGVVHVILVIVNIVCSCDKNRESYKQAGLAETRAYTSIFPSPSH